MNADIRTFSKQFQDKNQDSEHHFIWKFSVVQRETQPKTIIHLRIYDNEIPKLLYFDPDGKVLLVNENQTYTLPDCYITLAKK